MSIVLATRAHGLAEQICDKLVRWSEYRHVIVNGYEIVVYGAARRDFTVHVLLDDGSRSGGFRVINLGGDSFVWGFWLGEGGERRAPETANAFEIACLVQVLGAFHRALVLAMVNS